MGAEQLCMGCMREIGEAERCPHCGFYKESPQIAPYLSLRSVVDGRYLIGKLLRSNGEAAVYVGFDLESRTRVTVREFLPEGYFTRNSDTMEIRPKTGSEQIFNRNFDEFLELWRKVARMRELSAVVPVLDILVANGTAYIVSEYVEHITLRDFLSKNRAGYLSFEQAKGLFLPMQSTLSALHSHGIVHRGISPDTLIIGRDGKLRITDFAAQAARTLGTDLNAELFSGYAPIEQYGFDGRQGTWSDVYAFAAVLYRTLTGVAPQEARERVTDDKMTIPAQIAANIPDYAVVGLTNALQILPQDRTRTMDALREELSGAVSPVTENDVSRRTRRTEKPTADTPEAQKKKSMKLLLTTMGICVGVALVILAVCLLVRPGAGNENESNPPQTTQGESAMVEVPDFVKTQTSYARISSDSILNSRFKFTVEYAFDSKVEQGFIVSQSVAAGEQVPEGTEIKLVVSKGAEQIVLPSVVGEKYEAAYKRLTDLGFVCKKIEKPNDGTGVEGMVFAVTPQAGAEYPRGKEIILQVWGPERSAEETTVTADDPDSGSAMDDLKDLLNQFRNR